MRGNVDPALATVLRGDAALGRGDALRRARSTDRVQGPGPGAHDLRLHAAHDHRHRPAAARAQRAHAIRAARWSSAIDPNGGRAAFDVDGFGQVVRARDPAGNETRSTFDLRGRVVAVDEPNLGTWSYRYDALGAADRTARREGNRDSLHVRRARDEWSAATTAARRRRWTWDTAPNGIGQLARVAALPDGTAREESYDGSAGRARRPRASGDQLAPRAASVRRLRPGRRGSSTPSGFSVVQRYTESGQLESVERRTRSKGSSGPPSRASRTGASSASDSATDCARIASTSPRRGASRANPHGQRRRVDDPVGELRLGPARQPPRPRGSEPRRHRDLQLRPVGPAAERDLVAARHARPPLRRRRQPHLQDGSRRVSVPGAGEPAAARGARDQRRRPPLRVRRERQPARRRRGPRRSSGPPATSCSRWASPAPTARSSSSATDPRESCSTRLEIDASPTGSSTYVVQLGAALRVGHRPAQRPGRAAPHDLRRRRARRRSHDGEPGPGGHALRAPRPPRVDQRPDRCDRRPGRADPLRPARRGPRAAGRRRRPGDPAARRAARLLGRGPAAPVPARAPARPGLRPAPRPIPVTRPGGERGDRSAVAERLRLRAEQPAVARRPERAHRRSSPPSAPAPDEGWFGPAARALRGTPSRASRSDFAAGVVGAAASFLAASWGGVRFAATAAWNGIGWAGNQLASGASALGRKAWDVYNDDFNLGILPDKRVPFGLPQSIVLGFMQWRDQQLELWDVCAKRATTLVMTPPRRPDRRERLRQRPAERPRRLRRGTRSTKFDGQPCILAYNASVNFISDTVESALMKFAPSAASHSARGSADSRRRTPVHIVGHSQGTLTLFWATPPRGSEARRRDRRLLRARDLVDGVLLRALVVGCEGRVLRLLPQETTIRLRPSSGATSRAAWLCRCCCPARLVFSAESIPLASVSERQSSLDVSMRAWHHRRRGRVSCLPGLRVACSSFRPTKTSSSWSEHRTSAGDRAIVVQAPARSRGAHLSEAGRGARRRRVARPRPS